MEKQAAGGSIPFAKAKVDTNEDHVTPLGARLRGSFIGIILRAYK